jgi:hypothetical protein
MLTSLALLRIPPLRECLRLWGISAACQLVEEAVDRLHTLVGVHMSD